LKHELNRANKNLQQTQHELDQVQDKLAQANEHIERMKKKKPDEDLEEIKHERDQFREKSNRVNEELDEVKRERDNYKKKLKEANEKLAELERDQEKLVRPREKKPVTYQSGRSSSPPTPPKRSTSPITVKSPK
jgi:chromosome segregation ATPase